MTHVEFEKHFAEQAERFGVAKIIRQRGEDYAFQSFMLALSGIVARDEPKPVDEEKLDELATRFYYTDEDAASYDNEIEIITEAFKAGYRKALELWKIKSEK